MRYGMGGMHWPPAGYADDHYGGYLPGYLRRWWQRLKDWWLVAG